MMRGLPLLACLVACADEPREPVAVEPEVLSEVTQATSVCAAGPTVYGIDVSRYQGDIDWDLVAGSGVKYAFIQISRSLTDIDVKFDYNWRRAKEVGVLRGAYQRFQPAQDVLGQAELFVEKLGPYVAGDLPPVLDVEDANGLTGAQIAAAVEQWMTYVEAHVGLKPIIYTGFYFWRDSVDNADFREHPLWIANYGSDCPLVPLEWATWTFHQYSSTATIPGITANTVDVNRFNGTEAELAALAIAPMCGDGRCNGTETAESCADDCVCATIDASQTGTIIDDAGPCFVAGGNPAYMRSEAAGFGASLRWTHATDSATASNFGEWSLDFAEAGRYRVEAHTPAPFNDSKQAVYQVQHGDTRTLVSIDQSLVDGWTVLGELDFVAGTNGQLVRLDDNTGEPNASDTQIVFDALRLTKLDSEEVPQPETSGCATTGGDRSLLLALLVLVGSLVHGPHSRSGRRAARRNAARIRH